MYACTTADPGLADVLLREIQPGDLLRVTGIVVPSHDLEAPARFTVVGLEVLEAAPASVLLYDLVLERYGNYVVVFDADRDQVPVFTKHGKWVGEATKPSCPTRSSPASSTCAAPAANQWLALFGLPSRVEPKLIELAPARGWAQQDDDTWSCDEPPK
ncbi:MULTISPECIES: hypothetical protein [Streptomyces]|uniref:hypothetical protein n=1 Tax=Streptomyces TaxID=1883 RepID=UPI00067D6053|nr:MULTISPECIES: hypothetical protein [Streptomyces]KUJ42854.1 hypothetical protein ACZ90_67650 [Streptomyces albus subsp. albus]MDX2918271.1 hypothetical protein [Streptomyces sp. NE06-03C]MDX3608930.1 hypothetical protein [Streptomyces sp. FL06-04B]MDX3739635.1 hypothetical protein [Streptomyces sp. ID01-15D]